MDYDPHTRLNTYSYTVTNDRTSEQAVENFYVDHASPITGIRSPSGWVSGEVFEQPTLGWDAIAVANPNEVTNDASIPPSIVQIKPGQRLSGFAFQSPRPPGPVKYYVLGFAPVPPQVGTDEAEAEMKAEALAEACPELDKPALEQAVTGATVGPVDFLPVKIDIRPDSKRNPINPESEGVVPVAVRGSRDFDVRQIDQASLRLGPGQAAPRGKGRLLPNRMGALDLLVLFPTQAIGLRCEDTALFLSGKTLDGTALKGADSVTIVGCARAQK